MTTIFDGDISPVGTEVTLSWSEVRDARYRGVDRNLRNVREQRRSGRGLDRSEWTQDLLAACGECAAAKALDLFWCEIGRNPERRIAQVGEYSVHTTDRLDGHLILYREDADDMRFMLVIATGDPLRYVIPGWITGADGKQFKWWRDDVRSAAYFVPQTALTPLR